MRLSTLEILGWPLKGAYLILRFLGGRLRALIYFGGFWKGAYQILRFLDGCLIQSGR